MLKNNEPIAGREATDGFEEWWLANGPCEGNSSYRKIGWAITVMKNMCEKSWNAAQLAAQPSVQRNEDDVFNEGVRAATSYLRGMHNMETLAFLTEKTVLRITAERGSK